MKKILLGLGAVVSIAIPVVAVISCGAKEEVKVMSSKERAIRIKMLVERDRVNVEMEDFQKKNKTLIERRTKL